MMFKTSSIWLLAVLLNVAPLLPTESHAQPRRAVRQGPPPIQLDAAQQKTIIAALQQRIRESYTFPDQAENVTAYLAQRLASGDYDKVTDGFEFGRQLTSDLRAHTQDGHFAVMYDPLQYDRVASMGGGSNPALMRFAGPGPQMPAPGTPMYDQIVEPLRQRNFNMTKLEVLDGNVGYLRLEAMPPLEVAQATVDAMMQFLANADAYIIDLRSTPGGVGGFIPYLMSYFFADEGKLLFEREFAYADTTVRFTTYADLPSPRQANKPLYVLISGATGSAAENLAYTLQQHDRATVVGAASRGAAHSSTMTQLADGFVAQIPIARVLHPVSGSNWQGDGVQPDILTSAHKALAEAHIAALSQQINASANPQQRAQLEQILDNRQREMAQTAATQAQQASAFTDYEGRYQERSVFVEGGVLRYQREGGPPLRLEQKDTDVFVFDLDPGMRSPTPLPTIRFDRNPSGGIIGMTFIRDDGSVEATFPKEN